MIFFWLKMKTQITRITNKTKGRCFCEENTNSNDGNGRTR